MSMIFWNALSKVYVLPNYGIEYYASAMNTALDPELWSPGSISWNKIKVTLVLIDSIPIIDI